MNTSTVELSECSASTPHPPLDALRDLETGDVLDDFEILTILSRSGMGSVYKGRHRVTDQRVVVKIPYPQFEADVVLYARFERERRIGNKVDHPGIVRMIAVPDQSRPYLVTEYVKGESLHTIMVREGPMAPERALRIAREVCEALGYLHQHGIVHRDIKPENILITEDGHAKIIDFGIALDISSRRLTWAGLSSTVGTPWYMAPEQIRGRRGDARADQYALGLILYEMLAGKSAYDAPNTLALIRAKRRQRPIPLAQAAPEIDAALAAVVMRAIEPDRRARFASTEDFLASLRDPRAAPTQKSMHPSAARRPREPRSFGWRLALLSAAVMIGFLALLPHKKTAVRAGVHEQDVVGHR